jgi:hypothetical protein
MLPKLLYVDGKPGRRSGSCEVSRVLSLDPWGFEEETFGGCLAEVEWLGKMEHSHG